MVKGFNEALLMRHGAEYLTKVSEASVAVAGLGGIGSNTAVLLCRMGIGRLHLIDYDIVDESNINRQQYYLRHIGQQKTAALAELLLSINSEIELQLDNVRVTENNINEIFQEDYLICEAFDNAESKAMLVNGILAEKSKTVIACSGMAGFCDSNLIVTKKINNRFYLCGDSITDCSNEALAAARVMLCAAHQANLAVRIILGMEE